MLIHIFTGVNAGSSCSSDKEAWGWAQAVSAPGLVKEANHERTQVFEL